MHISAKCSIAIHCLLFIHEYGSDNKVTSELLSRSTGCNPVVIRGIVSALKKDGILAPKADSGGSVLACPSKEITLYRVCMALEPDCLDRMIGVHPSPSQFCPVGRRIRDTLKVPYRKIRDDMAQSLQNITLEDVIQSYHQTSDE